MIIFGLFLLTWIIFAQSCMTFRKADKEMKETFSKNGVTLYTTTERIQDRDIHYAKTGSDTLPTIFFVHGTPGSWDAFSGYMQDKELLQHYRMISFDRPGFGYSDFGKALHLEANAQLISPIIHKMNNGKPVYLAGHSLGGPLIVKMAADYPDYFDGLVIISGSVDPAEEKPEKWRPVLFRSPLNLLIPGAFRPSNVELWWLKKDLVQLKEDFARINCQVVFIHGLKDTWVPPGNVEYAKKLLVNAPSVGELMIPDANHFIPWTKFREIKDVLLHLKTEDSLLTQRLNRAASIKK